MKSVSAIIPVYNVSKYVRRCLDSVVNQTVLFERIIIINDGSTDGSDLICKEYCHLPSVVLINKNNGGLVSAWKEGLRYIETEFVCFIDSDDYISTDYLQTLIEAVDTDDIDMVCMNCTRVSLDGTLSNFIINGLDEGLYSVDDRLKSILLSDFGSFIRPISSSRWAKLIRSSLVLNYSEFCSEKIIFGEDQQLILGILVGCNKIRIIEENKYFYQYNDTSILHTYSGDLWPKIKLLMNTIKRIPGISKIPNFQKQFNTQFLLYFCECLRNEVYNKSLTKEYYTRLIISDEIQFALLDYYYSKMRRIDKLLIFAAKIKSYSLTLILLYLYITVYKLRNVQG